MFCVRARENVVCVCALCAHEAKTRRLFFAILSSLTNIQEEMFKNLRAFVAKK